MSRDGAASSNTCEKLKPDSEFILVPHQYLTDTSAVIWVGAYGSDLQNVSLRFRKKGEENWDSRPVAFASEAPGIRYDTVTIPLEPGVSYDLELIRATPETFNLLDVAQIRGKPLDLEDGFTLWFGTCFYQPKDQGALNEAFAAIPERYLPDATILGGDQVYLDTAYADSSGSPIPGLALKNFFWRGTKEKEAIRAQLSEIFIKEYRRNWSKGLRSVLRSGATYFLAGDHEFWNDYPNTPIFMPVLRTPEIRDNWADLASRLFRGYQCPRNTTFNKISIGDELSVFVLDTHVQRQPGANARFTDCATLDACMDWLKTLACPGVMVLPAPLLTRWQFKRPGSAKARWVKCGGGDHTLADTGQYAPLVQALNESRQDILVIAGDVHFSRQAEMQLNGKQVSEIIASPLSCLPTAGAAAHKVPAVFPDRPVTGVNAAVEYRKAGSARLGLLGRKSQNNFVTVRFSRGEAGVHVDVVCWSINERDAAGHLKREWSREGHDRILLRARETGASTDADDGRMREVSAEAVEEPLG